MPIQNRSELLEKVNAEHSSWENVTSFLEKVACRPAAAARGARAGASSHFSLHVFGELETQGRLVFVSNRPGALLGRGLELGIVCGVQGCRLGASRLIIRPRPTAARAQRRGAGRAGRAV